MITDMKEYQKQYYTDNCEVITKNKLQYRKEKRKYVDDYKLSKGCSICGYNKCAAALVFHHNGDKKYGISEGLNSRRIDTLKEEMDKCIILCQNCHVELHDKIIKGQFKN